MNTTESVSHDPSVRHAQTSAVARPLASQLGDHVLALDGIRGTAILFVMLYHFLTSCGFGTEATVTRAIIALATNLWCGVDIFFTLSGFLITGILLRVKSEPGYFRNFYMRRSLRIFPLYYAALILVFGLLPLFNSPALDTPGVQRIFDSQWWLWAYSEDIAVAYYNDDFFNAGPICVGHFWSLAVEEHFYLFWPVVVYVCSRRGLLWACLTLIVLGPVIRMGLLTLGLKPIAVYAFTLSRTDELAVGGLLAWLAHEYDHARLARWARFAGGASALYLAVSIVGSRKPFHWSSIGALSFGFSALAFGTAALIVFSVGPQPTLLKKAIEAPWLRTFGKYSYGAYVVHIPLLPFFLWLVPPQAIGDLVKPLGHTATQLVGLLGFVTIAIALSMLLAVVSFHYFEQPFNRLKRHFEYGSSRPKHS